ncbi:MAG: efflux RND transporter permease subunit [Lentisphaeria bacterium]|nr:efflux RND transporter permease subunit [Lentisphaeria bacterium]
MKRLLLLAAAVFGIIVLSGCMCGKQPSVFVTATYPGAGSEKIVASVAAPIEAEMNRLDNLLYLSSESSDAGKYRLTLRFKHGTDMALAKVDVMNGIKRAEASLPEEVRMFGIHVTSDSPEEEKACKTDQDRILTRDGLPVAQIVVEKGGDLTEQYAAKELQFWLKKITGAELPIVHTVADDRLNLLVGGGNVVGGATTYTFNQYNTSPKALDRLEIYRQTRNQLNFAKGV